MTITISKPSSKTAPKKNNILAKKAATQKTAVKAGRVTKPVKKNTRKAAKDTANTAAAADTATTTATPNVTAEGSGSSAAAPKERFSAKNPPPDFIGEKFNTLYEGCVKAWIAGRNNFVRCVSVYSITKRYKKCFLGGHKYYSYPSVIVLIARRAAIAEKEDLPKYPEHPEIFKPAYRAPVALGASMATASSADSKERIKYYLITAIKDIFGIVDKAREGQEKREASPRNITLFS
ncbi:hypothetical protein ACRALDRAFT_1069314 [Sodiomyces alcalophilus JCM 7366]|uniref:uncharacterized protein n=1 Tax=Sodiomyces alcalophilus JCM 7366 TaxID=591952 RepID=UPI0039B5E70F